MQQRLKERLKKKLQDGLHKKKLLERELKKKRK